MGITYDGSTETIAVTGGSNVTPYTMARLKSSGTSGGYIATGGFGGNTYTLSANLRVGSEDADTFFDLAGSIAQTNSPYTMQFYATALRGGRMTNSWADRVFQGVARPSDDACKMRGVIRAYCRRIYHQCPYTGEFIREEAIDAGKSYDPYSETEGQNALGLSPGGNFDGAEQGGTDGTRSGPRPIYPDIFRDILGDTRISWPQGYSSGGGCGSDSAADEKRHGGYHSGPAATDIVFEVASSDRAL